MPAVEWHLLSDEVLFHYKMKVLINSFENLIDHIIVDTKIDFSKGDLK